MRPLSSTNVGLAWVGGRRALESRRSERDADIGFYVGQRDPVAPLLAAQDDVLPGSCVIDDLVGVVSARRRPCARALSSEAEMEAAAGGRSQHLASSRSQDRVCGWLFKEVAGPSSSFRNLCRHPRALPDSSVDGWNEIVPNQKREALDGPEGWMP